MQANSAAAAITFKINAKGGATTRGSFLALPGEEDLSSFSGERRELWLRNRLSWLRAGVYKLLISKPSLLEKAGAAMVMRMSGNSLPPFLPVMSYRIHCPSYPTISIVHYCTALRL